MYVDVETLGRFRASEEYEVTLVYRLQNEVAYLVPADIRCRLQYSDWTIFIMDSVFIACRIDDDQIDLLIKNGRTTKVTMCWIWSIGGHLLVIGIVNHVSIIKQILLTALGTTIPATAPCLSSVTFGLKIRSLSHVCFQSWFNPIYVGHRILA